MAALRLAFMAAALLPLGIAGCGFGAEEEDEGYGSPRDRHAAILAADAQAPAPGEWERSLSVKQIDLPGMARKREGKITAQIERDGSGKSCISKRQAKAIAADLFAPDGEQCRYSEFSAADGKVTLGLSCGMESLSAIDMQLSGPLGANSYDLSGLLTIRLPMVGKVEAQISLSGARLGGC